MADVFADEHEIGRPAMVTSGGPNTLASSAAVGDEAVCLAGPVPAPGYITLSAGTPHAAELPAFRCVGEGPYIVHLGYSRDRRVAIGHASGPHCAGSPVTGKATPFDYADNVTGSPLVFDRITGLFIHGPAIDLRSHVGKQIGIEIDGTVPQYATLCAYALRDARTDMFGDTGTAVYIAPPIAVPSAALSMRVRLLDLESRPIIPGVREANRA